LELNLLQPALPKATFEDGESLLADLRMQKDVTEVEAMRKAARIAQESLVATLPKVRIGATEREIAAELTMQLFRAGSDPALPFTPIVSGGPNSANPHAMPSDRALAPGDLLVIDWGATYQGYYSDITRTFALGSLEPEFSRITGLVLEANAAGRAACKPGASASSIDHAARSIIEAGGYGEQFRHRTGHGLGLEVHEEPYIRADNLQSLLPGMTFTVEPGIYLAGRGGVRIEDDVVITDSGCESLTDLPRPVQVLAG
jgi:Xaa-Pro dipeptidase